MKVPGLCIGGGGVTLGNKEDGHVFFMRKEEGADKKHCELYMNEVLVPHSSMVCVRKLTTLTPKPVQVPQQHRQLCHGVMVILAK